MSDDELRDEEDKELVGPVKLDDDDEVGADGVEVGEVLLEDGSLSLDALAEEEEEEGLDMDDYDDKDAF